MFRIDLGDGYGLDGNADLLDVPDVPAELSCVRAKGRVGKIDRCLHCGETYLVKTWTQLHCTRDCSAQAAGFANDTSRKKSYLNSK